MAKKKSTGGEVLAAKSSYPDVSDKWRTEEDERRLTAAAEVMADRKRLKAALACMRQKNSMVERLVSVSRGK